MIAQVAKDNFWGAVADCLVEFHQLSLPDAVKQCNDLRTQIESPPSGMSSEIFYHSEPFDVACDIVDRQLDIRRFRKRYDAILSRRGW